MLYPHSNGDSTIVTEEVDELYFGRIVLLAALSLFLAGGCGAVVVLQCAETVYASPVRRRPVSVR